MISKKTVGIIAGTWAAASGVAAHILRKKAEQTTYAAELMDSIEQREMGFYERYAKRALDVACASAAITIFSPIYIVVAALVRIKLGSPVLFTQERPGLIGSDGKERIFKMYKFRSMTDAKDKKGNLMPDEERLTTFGKKLRATSLDELPEAFNILNGTMSIIGPRPQLVRDMVFMSDKQRERHTAKPGLSGLAQVMGRNAIAWEEKLNWDCEYIKNINFLEDTKIVLMTIRKTFFRKKTTINETDITDDFGDALLNKGLLTKSQYEAFQLKAKKILGNINGKV